MTVRLNNETRRESKAFMHEPSPIRPIVAFRQYRVKVPHGPRRGIMSWEDHERREQFGRLLGYYRRKAA